MREKRRKLILALFMSFVFILSATGLVVNQDYAHLGNQVNGDLKSVNKIYSTDNFSNLVPLNSYVMTGERYHVSNPQPVNATSGHITDTVGITLNFANQTRLNSFLENLSNRGSPGYMHYLTRKQFDRNFEPSASVYNSLMEYLQSRNITTIHAHSGRMLLTFTASVQKIDSLFKTSTENYLNGSQLYHAITSKPELPSYFVPLVSSITGLSNYSQYAIGASSLKLLEGKTKNPVTNSKTSGYLTPVCSAGSQYIYGPDLQVAYGEQPLFKEYGYPVNSVEATILWGGKYTAKTMTTPYGVLNTDQRVGPFVPSNIYDYYNETIPAGEPHSTVYGVPLNGAVAPGPLAQYDNTSANFENTLDLEMMGSTAPGSSIYNVYGNNSCCVNILDSFNFILNPNSTYSKLDNVSVISNSWGACDNNFTGVYNYLKEAQARGITVLASSGDAADNSSSAKWTGSDVEALSNMAYNDFGVIAVGGTSVKLNLNTLKLENETNWFILGGSTPSGTYGTSSGISQVIKEPAWQINSLANSLIQGRGRGVPDISAIANNTLITISFSGHTYYASNATYGGPFEYSFGTSISSPLTGGILAEIDCVLHKNNESKMGFVDPTLYKLGTQEYRSQKQTAISGFYDTGKYNSTLPALPFYPVDSGHNQLYKARYGYSLLDGWGSINAYNLTDYLLSKSFSSNKYALTGVDDNLSMKDLKVTSFNSTGHVYNIYNASIQQNLFLSNEMGQPLYWIQNVIYLNGSAQTGFEVNYTGWVVYPFYGLYPSQTVYRYTFPMGKTIGMPHYFNMSTVLNYNGNPMDSYVTFMVNRHAIDMNVTGAAYIIGKLNYSYIAGDQVNYGGPYPDNNVPGGLDPQFGLVGGPSGEDGHFMFPTTGSLKTLVRTESGPWIKPRTRIFGLSNDQTGEVASNLNYTMEKQGEYNITIKNGSMEQGIISYVVPVEYKVNFTESGLPSAYPWYVNISLNDSGPIFGKSYSILLPNGSYSYTIGTDKSSSFRASIASGSFVVNGKSYSVPEINFTEVTFKVEFKESGLPAGTTWNISLSHKTYSSGDSNLTLKLINGSYIFHISNTTDYYDNHYLIAVTVNGHNITENIEFIHYSYIYGTINPSGAHIAINGKDVRILSGGKFNITVTAGNYTITASLNGYSPQNFNLAVGHNQSYPLNINLKKAPSVNYIYLYITLLAFLIIIIMAAVIYLKYKR